LNRYISDKDKKDWLKFINSREKLPNKELKDKKIKNLKIKSIDLHGYTLNEANQVIENFINKAFSENINKLIVITGKGLHSQNEKDPYVSKNLSILRFSVPEFILNNKNLMTKINEIKEANLKDGGAGAFYIFLKKNKN
tara:strand:- start:96 stop:512 length:417 start_codon:yes stop_codon:yes gene_type:complete